MLLFAGFSLVVARGGCSPVVMQGLLTEVASLVGSRACGPQELRLCSCSFQALEPCLNGRGTQA